MAPPPFYRIVAYAMSHLVVKASVLRYALKSLTIESQVSCSSDVILLQKYARFSYTRDLSSKFAKKTEKSSQLFYDLKIVRISCFTKESHVREASISV